MDMIHYYMLGTALRMLRLHYIHWTLHSTPKRPSLLPLAVSYCLSSPQFPGPILLLRIAGGHRLGAQGWSE
jgi:hypothetical protein